MKDLNYFIQQAKDDIRKEMKFEDFLDVIASANEDEQADLTEAWRKGESRYAGVLLNVMIDESIDKQQDVIMERATEACREHREDRKAEVYEQRYLARMGA